MKIALVHMRHAGTGGTERYLNQVARYLAERGDDVSIVCRSYESPPHPSVRFVRLHPLAVGGTWRMSSFARAVEKHVASTQYDVVYGLGKTWTQDVIRLGGGCHATYLALAHDATRTKGSARFASVAAKHRAALAIEDRAFRSPSLKRVVVNSRMVWDDVVRRYGTPAEKLRLVYNGVDVERFHPRLRVRDGAQVRSEMGFAPDDAVMLFLGSGYARKGLDVVIEALPRVFAARPRACLAVVGYDSSASAYASAVDRLGFGDRVRFLGGRRDAERIYAAADVYVLPTRYDPFANTTLEALASGLPVITSAANGGSELIEEGVTGSVLARDVGGAALDAARESAWIAALESALIDWTDPDRFRAARTPARAVAERRPDHATACESAAVLDEVLLEKTRCATS